MKKTAILVLALMMCAMFLTGCKTKNEDMIKIGIVQIMEHPSLDTIRESFIAALADRGYVDGQNISIDYQNAQNDQSNLNSICNKFVGNNVDLIVAIATPTAQAAVSATNTIPVLFSAVTDPVAAKLVIDPNYPEANTTGTSDAIPVDEVFDLCKELTPNVKKFGFLYTSSEVNSKAVVDLAKELCAEYDFEYEEMTITSTSELKQAATTLAGRVDAIYTPIDNTIASAMPTLAQVCIDAKIPVYVGADSMVVDGGYATVGINYTTLGEKTAELAVQILEGTPISQIPVATLNSFDKVINKTTAESIGATSDSFGAIIVE